MENFTLHRRGNILRVLCLIAHIKLVCEQLCACNRMLQRRGGALQVFFLSCQESSYQSNTPGKVAKKHYMLKHWSPTLEAERQKESERKSVCLVASLE